MMYNRLTEMIDEECAERGCGYEVAAQAAGMTERELVDVLKNDGEFSESQIRGLTKFLHLNPLNVDLIDRLFLSGDIEDDTETTGVIGKA